MTRALRCLTCFRHNTDGAIGVFLVLALPIFLMMAALVIDIGLGRVTGNRLQIAADASALAGASQLPDQAAATIEAISYAQKNHADVDGNGVLVAADVSFGNWSAGVFTPSGTPINAVRTVTRRDTNNSNPLAALFANLAGISEFNLVRAAVAHLGAGQGCKGGGLFSDENVESGSNNSYISEFCLYGADGVKIGSDNVVAPGTQITMNDLGDFEQGGANTGTAEALAVADHTLLLPGLVPSIISDMRADAITNMPPFITDGPVELSEITDTTPLQDNTLYIVEEVADLGSDRNLSNIAIVAQKEVKLGSNNVLSNAIFASNDKILIGSNNQIGDSGYCSTGYFNIYLFSEENIEFGSNNNLQGVQIGGQKELKLGSDVAGLSGVFAEVSGKIDYGSADTWDGCAEGLESYFALPVIPGGANVLALVQ
ncbi:hypothetical protein ACMU_16575 [Actibacterium mucosum KCTC 23349]|uniref:Uncharacterized protein n=1 Tax=Actibacterium mucosum KCTC 23349 TaxID=1454373 RepID=A0A037ZE08_9RHOB|nr:pilus assembly protein TadG-related protein [Actibacterium mucosum]KAJ54729.1 hypothetical protein ACMU_16575 [Actibacterium mucosum KCTC 23349]